LALCHHTSVTPLVARVVCPAAGPAGPKSADPEAATTAATPTGFQIFMTFLLAPRVARVAGNPAPAGCVAT
jgi:hypothetical protein